MYCPTYGKFGMTVPNKGPEAINNTIKDIIRIVYILLDFEYLRIKKTGSMINAVE
jgi:hypothetical protein